MKFLLDENLPTKLKVHFETEEHAVFTVRDMNWSGTKNGKLLALMSENGFDVLVTMDKKLGHQQNLDQFPINIVIFDALNNKIETLKPFVNVFLSRISLVPLMDKITVIGI